MVAVLLLRQQSEDIRYEHLKTESKWVVAVLADIQQNKGSSANFASLSDYTLGAIRSVPTAYLKVDVAGTTVLNGFGGNVHVGPLSLGAASNAYAMNYTSVPRDVCARLVVLLNETAKADAPLYSIVGDVGVTPGVPDTTIGLKADGSVLASGTDQKVLKPSTNAGLDMEEVANFCGNTKAALRSLTLIRWP